MVSCFCFMLQMYVTFYLNSDLECVYIPFNCTVGYYMCMFMRLVMLQNTSIIYGFSRKIQHLPCCCLFHSGAFIWCLVGNRFLCLLLKALLLLLPIFWYHCKILSI